MLINLCLHSHNFFCDGKNKPEDYIQYAVYKGFTQYGFSSHAPLKIYTKWAMKHENLEKYASEIDLLKEKYNGKIDIFKSLEIDYIPDDTYSFNYFKEKIGLDYTVGSIHLVKNPHNQKILFIDGPQSGFDEGLKDVFDGDIEAAVKQYFKQTIEMIELHQPDILGHMDKVLMNNANRYFTHEDSWYQEAIAEVLKTAKKHNTIIEINTRSRYQNRWEDTYPGKYLWKSIQDLELPILLSSDAHKPQEIDGFYEQTRKELLDYGFTQQMMIKGNKWTPVDL
jgi:histidinol-phosphatase (PHP family)